MEFEAVVEAGRGGGALVRLPDDAADHFGTRGRFPVRATFNGVAYRGSTMPMGDGTFCLGVTKAVQAETGVRPGGRVSVVVERDEEERTVALPVELADALARHPEAAARFERMPFTHRREYAEWIASAKRPETRQRRVERALERIVEGRPPG